MLRSLTSYDHYACAFLGIAHDLMSVIRVLFALNIAFLAHDTWTAHDRALDVVFQEAGPLSPLVILAVLIFAVAAAATAAIILVHGNPFPEPAAVSPDPITALARPAR